MAPLLYYQLIIRHLSEIKMFMGPEKISTFEVWI